MMRREQIPNALTLGNAACGVLALTQTAAGEHVLAAWLVFFAMFFDLLDGRVAKALGVTSRLGALLDTLSDTVTFVAAPAVLLHAVYFHEWGVAGLALMLCPVVAGLVRLARFTVTSEVGGPERAYFGGLPAPAAAGLLAGFVPFSAELFGAPAALPELRWAAAGLALLAAWLMVSGIPYDTNAMLRPGVILRNWKGLAYLASVALVATLRGKAYFAVAVAYVLLGLGRWVSARYYSPVSRDSRAASQDSIRRRASS